MKNYWDMLFIGIVTALVGYYLGWRWFGWKFDVILLLFSVSRHFVKRAYPDHD